MISQNLIDSFYALMACFGLCSFVFCAVLVIETILYKIVRRIWRCITK